jgi:hypothetical protein
LGVHVAGDPVPDCAVADYLASAAKDERNPAELGSQ